MINDSIFNQHSNLIIVLLALVLQEKIVFEIPIPYKFSDNIN